MQGLAPHSTVQVEEVTEPLFVLPTPAHAAGMHRLVQQSESLDENSAYAYLLMTTHFRDTCVVAEADGEVVGFVGAYCPPRQPETVFVWQIGVAASHRRRGMGLALLEHVLNAPACADVTHLEASVTPSNTGSRRLFERFAEGHDAAFAMREWFPVSLFGNGAHGHEPELLLRIGPLVAEDSAITRGT